MTLRDDLNALAPRLRRYARALTNGGPAKSENADDLVHATLMRMLGQRNLGSPSDLAVRCYAILTQLHRDSLSLSPGRNASHDAAPLGTSHAAVTLVVRQGKLAASLMSLPLEDREALLLVALETFSHADAARILRISRSTLFGRLTRARSALEDLLHAHPGRLVAHEHDRQVSHLRLVK